MALTFATSKADPERTCIGCGTSFSYDAGHLIGRGFRPPRYCATCLERRRERLVETTGVIVQVGGTTATLRSKDGRLWHYRHVDYSTVPPSRGQRFSFRFDPLEKPGPGQNVIARHAVRLPEHELE
jgi:hypothetical protein